MESIDTDTNTDNNDNDNEDFLLEIDTADSSA